MVKQLFSVDEARQRARNRLPRMMFDFIDGASGDESLCRLNSSVIDQIRLMPRVLIDVSERDLSSSILDQKTGLPFGIAPMGMCALAWPGADQFLAREAARRQIPLCVSTASSMALEQVIELAEGHAVGVDHLVGRQVVPLLEALDGVEGRWHLAAGNPASISASKPRAKHARRVKSSWHGQTSFASVAP